MTATVETQPSEAPSGGKVPLVELKNVGKSYGNITALKDICLRVHAGEVTGILGDNGAGKSTLIKIISGLHQQTDGELLVDGKPVVYSIGIDLEDDAGIVPFVKPGALNKSQPRNGYEMSIGYGPTDRFDGDWVLFPEPIFPSDESDAGDDSTPATQPASEP